MREGYGSMVRGIGELRKEGVRDYSVSLMYFGKNILSISEHLPDFLSPRGFQKNTPGSG
jgi:hypothetical protein